MYADIEVARRVGATFMEMARWTGAAAEAVDPSLAPAFVDFGGFGAMFCGDGSPLTQTTATVHDVEITPEKYAEVCRFYEGRAATWEMALGPFSHPGSWKTLQDAGWRVVGHENTLILPLAPHPPTPSLSEEREGGVVLETVTDDNREAWARAITEGFFGELTDEALKLAAILGATKNTVSLMATVDGEPAGGGSLIVVGRTAFLGGMATIERFRGRGIQTAITDRRLELAAEMGCDLVFVETLPGSQCQRNMERRGFRVAFTRCVLAKSS